MDSASTSQQQDLYRPAFVHNCLKLLVRARRRLTQALTTAEEPAITGLLVASAKELIETDDAEPSFEHLIVLDDPPQNDDPDRLGKARPRIDIEFVETRKGRRPRFHVEAKRLHRSDSVNEYLGVNGIGMFITGLYAKEWSSAGMLGYVQSDNCAAWLAAIERGMSSREIFRSVRLRNAGWETEGLQEVKESYHDRAPKSLGPVSMYHLLIDVQS